MAKDKSATATSSFFRELFHVGLYKRSQGKVARQVTFAAAAICIVLGTWRLWHTLRVWQPQFLFDLMAWMGVTSFAENYSSYQLHFIIPAVLLLGGLWISYRVVNLPRFADFLIAVEAEMNKVSWPTRAELLRSSLVVIVVIFFLAAILFGFDMFWGVVFRFLGIIA